MGKVYDALRKAEEQRALRVEEVASGPAPILPEMPREPLRSPQAPSEPLLPPPKVPVAPRPGLLSRLFGSRAKTKAQGDSASEFNKRRIALLQPESFVAEQFRTLRARIDSIAATNPIRTLAFTSARAGEGKTMASLSLAVVSAMSMERRILLVDCDLRLPTIHRSLGLRPDAGLAEVLKGEASAEDAILKVDGTDLDVLPVRGVPSNPAELLASERMSSLLEELAGRYDRVILDLPCTLGLPDTKIVSEMCDGLVFVVRADVTPDEEVAAAIDVLDRRRIVGVVLNGAESAKAYGPYFQQGN